MENRCISCGEIIPEGLQVCHSCMKSPGRKIVRCVKPAYDLCPFNVLCDPGCKVGENTDCAEFIASIMAIEEKKAGRKDGQA